MASSKYGVDIDSGDLGTSHGLMLDLVGADRSVLDLGCAEGDLARALAGRGCHVWGVEINPEAAQRARPDLKGLVVGDLEVLDLTALFDAPFDVVVLGDVLEHLRDPLKVMRQVKHLLVPGGSVVASIPNVAHAAVRLSLLTGRFTYGPTGLLDETHLRFFDRSAVEQLVRDSGLIVVDMRRTVLGPFDSEIQIRHEDLPFGAVEMVMQDEDAITYQFVFEALVDDADGRVRRRASEVEELRRQAKAADAAREQLTADIAASRREAQEARIEAATANHQLLAAEAALTAADERYRRLEDRLAEVETRRRAELNHLQAELDQVQVDARQARAALAAVHASTAWRLSAPIRALGPLRAAVQGPVQNRRSLRSRRGLAALSTHLNEQGWSATVERIRAEVGSGGRDRAYRDWVQAYDQLTSEDMALIGRHIERTLAQGPLISIVMPVYDTDPQLLREALTSVLEQLYPHWQLCVADDASPSAQTRAVLEDFAANDPRLVCARREINGGIAAATNTALGLATGEFIAFMDHDDLLAPHALYLVALTLHEHPDTDLVYTDEDKLDSEGRRYDPHFKPDLDPELLLAQNYMSHLTVIRSTLVEELRGLREDLEGSQDHDLVLRVLEKTSPARVKHVPFVLYHWRQWSGSGTFSSHRLEEATASSRRAVMEHLQRTGQQQARVVPAPARPYWNRVIRPVPSPQPVVTAVIPTRDRLPLLRQCVEGLLSHTDYDALKVLIVDNDSTESETLEWLAAVTSNDRVQVLRSPGPFNYSALNNEAVKHVASPLLLLLNNDIRVREPGWLQEMVSLVSAPGTGAVGARLLYADGTVQHAGVILGLGGVAGHSHKHFPASSVGYFGRLALTQSVSAVTGACLLTRTDLYRQVGGLDSDRLKVAFNDVDLCLKIRSTGNRIIVTPFAELDHLESASRGAEETPAKIRRFNGEIEVMKARWDHLLRHDPAYNPNLTDCREDFSLAFPPRRARPWTSSL